ncbi:MAG: 50S ribosomal protein L31 [Bacilli bacterium]
MKKAIHPVLKECKVKCACGNEFITKSTKDEIQLETCNKCHSFYTGKYKTVKTGNVQKFKDKYGLE